MMGSQGIVNAGASRNIKLYVLLVKEWSLLIYSKEVLRDWPKNHRVICETGKMICDAQILLLTWCSAQLVPRDALNYKTARDSWLRTPLHFPE